MFALGPIVILVVIVLAVAGWLVLRHFDPERRDDA